MIFCMYVKSHFNIIMFTQEDQQRYNKLFKSIFMQKMQFLFSNPKYLYAIAGQKPSCSVVGVLTAGFQVEIIETPIFQFLTKVLDTHLIFFILKSDSLSIIVKLPIPYPSLTCPASLSLIKGWGQTLYLISGHNPTPTHHH